MTDSAVRTECRWCHAHNSPDLTSCDHCGAPLDVRDRVTDAGWRQAPALRDLTTVHFASSSVQVDTGVVPIAEVELDAADTVFFEHHAMLWKHATVPMSVMTSPGGARRLLGNVPFVLSVAHGPGRLAFSRDAAGQLVILPVEPGQELEVRGHAMLLASGTLSYQFTKVAGVRTMLMAGTGMYLDRFSATGAPGVLVLHGFGNVFERTLAQGETVSLAPGAFLYKQPSVGMELVKIDIATAPDASRSAQTMATAANVAGRGLRGLKAMRGLMSDGVGGAAAQLLGGGGSALMGALGSTSSATLLRFTGPGRLGMQSMYWDRTTD